MTNTRPYHIVRSVSMRPAEWDAIKRAAKERGVSVNAFMRSAALKEAESQAESRNP